MLSDTVTVNPSAQSRKQLLARQKVLDAMTDSGKKLYYEMENLALDTEISTARRWWGIGEKVSSALKTPAEYGDSYIKECSELLRISEAILYSAKKFFSYFSTNDMDKLMSMRNAFGHPISWTQLRRICQYKLEKERWHWIELTLKNCWTFDEMAAAMNETKTGPATGHKGRTAAKPKNLNAMLDQVESMTSKLLKTCDDVWLNDVPDEENLIDMFDDLADEQLDKTLAERLQDDINTIRKTSTRMGSLADELQRKLVLIENELSSRGPTDTRRSKKTEATSA